MTTLGYGSLQRCVWSHAKGPRSCKATWPCVHFIIKNTFLYQKLESPLHVLSILLDTLTLKPPSCNVLRLDLISTGCRSQSSAQFLSGDQEPWAFRGGLAGEFQVSTPIQNSITFYFHTFMFKPINISVHLRKWKAWSAEGFDCNNLISLPFYIYIYYFSLFYLTILFFQVEEMLCFQKLPGGCAVRSCISHCSFAGCAAPVLLLRMLG